MIMPIDREFIIDLLLLIIIMIHTIKLRYAYTRMQQMGRIIKRQNKHIHNLLDFMHDTKTGDCEDGKTDN